MSFGLHHFNALPVVHASMFDCLVRSVLIMPLPLRASLPATVTNELSCCFQQGAKEAQGGR